MAAFLHHASPSGMVHRPSLSMFPEVVGCAFPCQVINVDYAANVVELMRKLTVGVQGLEWIVADAR